MWNWPFQRLTPDAVCDSQRDRHNFVLAGQTTYKSQLTVRVCFVGAPSTLQHNNDQKQLKIFCENFGIPSGLRSNGATPLVLIVLINGHHALTILYFTATPVSLSGCRVGFVGTRDQTPGSLGALRNIVHRATEYNMVPTV